MVAVGCSNHDHLEACQFLETSAIAGERARILGFGIPGEEYPDFLLDVVDVGVNQLLAFGFGIDGGEVGVRQDIACRLHGRSGIDQIVDQKPAGPAFLMAGFRLFQDVKSALTCSS